MCSVKDVLHTGNEEWAKLVAKTHIRFPDGSVVRQITPSRRRGGEPLMMSSHDGGDDDEHDVAVAAALQRARGAVAALAEPSPTFMDGMRSALQQAERRRCSSSREEGGRGGMN